MEIDLLSRGEATVRVPRDRLAGTGWGYLVAVSRCRPPRYEAYCCKLEKARGILPQIGPSKKEKEQIDRRAISRARKECG